MDIQTFETIIILTDEITDTDYDNAAYYYKNLIKELPSTKIKTEKLGKKMLAYEVKSHKQGYYLMFTYQSTGDLIKTRLDKSLRRDENVIKFITVAYDKHNYIPDPPEDVKSEQKTIDALDVLLGLAEYKNDTASKVNKNEAEITIKPDALDVLTGKANYIKGKTQWKDSWMPEIKKVMFDLFDEYEEYGEIKEALRSLHSEGSITDEEYDLALEHWDEWLEEWSK